MIKKGCLLGVLLCWVMAFPAMAQVGNLSSVSAVLYEPQSGRVLYEKDPDTKRPMASTTKLMTALVAAEYLSPQQVVTIPSAALQTEGSSMGLQAGDTLTVRDLLSGMLLSSGNDAANAVALLTANTLPAFAKLMNQKAALLGMDRSMFVTPSGLDEGEHGSTARDMALLGAAVLRSPLVAELCAQKYDTITLGNRKMTLKNHNRLLTLYEPTIGLKTGFTKKSGRCLVSAAERDGVTLVVATLNGGDYWNDHIALYEYGFSKTESVVPATPVLTALPIAGGTQDKVELVAQPPQAVTLIKGETLEAEVRLPSFMWAPIAQGDLVGTVVYRRGGTVVCENRILAAQAVEQRPPLAFGIKWWRQFIRLLME